MFLTVVSLFEVFWSNSYQLNFFDLVAFVSFSLCWFVIINYYQRFLMRKSADKIYLQLWAYCFCSVNSDNLLQSLVISNVFWLFALFFCIVFWIVVSIVG